MKFFSFFKRDLDWTFKNNLFFEDIRTIIFLLRK